MNHQQIKADVVGSLLRPQKLLQAQQDLAAGKITQTELTLIEDEAVKEVVIIQENIGLDILTDGEMRRPVFCHNFVKAVSGFEWDVPGNTVIWFDMDGKKIIDPVTVGVTAKLKKQHDISVDEFAFLRGVSNSPKKLTIPSPTMMSYFFAKNISDKIYPDPEKFLDEVTQILSEGVVELEKQGVKHLQIDAPEFGMLIDPIQRKWFAQKGFDPDQLISGGVKRINQVIAGFSGTTALHVCRGNDKNRFMATGGYEAIAPEVFAKTKVDRLLLEFDSDRAGDFSPLKHVSKNKTVVLGLITTKSPLVEKKSEIVARIKEAAKFIPLERLAISTQCGFASVAKGNHLTQDDQRKKLELVVEVAKEVWK